MAAIVETTVPKPLITLKGPGVKAVLYDDHFVFNKSTEPYEASRLIELLQFIPVKQRKHAASNFAVIAALTISRNDPSRAELKKQLQFLQLLSHAAKALLIASFALPALGLGEWLGKAIDNIIDLPLGGLGITAVAMWWVISSIPSFVDVWLNKTKEKLFYQTRERVRRNRLPSA
jgi:hypothetical protein